MFAITRYVFSTEGHLLPATPQISLVKEHCSYFGAYCSNGVRQENNKSDSRVDSEELNATKANRGWVHSRFHTSSQFSESTSISEVIKVRAN